jgi:TonB family protein
VPDKPAEPIRQALPSWQTRDQTSSQFGFKGAVKVTINAEGKVEAAVIVDSVHRSYDTLLLAAARTWLYKPAMKDGVAVPSEKIVQVELKPR